MSTPLTPRQILWLRTLVQDNAVLFIVPASNRELRGLEELGLAKWSQRKAQWVPTTAGRKAYRDNQPLLKSGTFLAV